MSQLLPLAILVCVVEGSQELAPQTKLNPLPKNFPIHLPQDSPLAPVAHDDTCYDAVAAEVARVKDNYARAGLLEPLMHGPPQEMKGRALAQLFPNHRFFVFVWSERVKEPLPPDTPRPIGLLVGARAMLAIDKNGVVERFGNHWSLELAAPFLAKNRVKIRNRRDARLVWNALCEIYRRERTGKIERVSDHLWRLGIEKTDGGRAYQEVRLSENFTVKAMKFVSEKPS